MKSLRSQSWDIAKYPEIEPIKLRHLRRFTCSIYKTPYSTDKADRRKEERRTERKGGGQRGKEED